MYDTLLTQLTNRKDGGLVGTVYVREQFSIDQKNAQDRNSFGRFQTHQKFLVSIPVKRNSIIGGEAHFQ